MRENCVSDGDIVEDYVLFLLPFLRMILILYRAQRRTYRKKGCNQLDLVWFLDSGHGSSMEIERGIRHVRRRLGGFQY